MTQQEVEEISEKVQIIINLDTSAFLKMVKDRADIWIEELTHGS